MIGICDITIKYTKSIIIDNILLFQYNSLLILFNLREIKYMFLSNSYNKNILVCLLASILLISSNAFAITYIKTCSELQNINQNLVEHYILANSIDCSNVIFEPIGSMNIPFAGTLDGAGYTISNLTINRTDENFGVALFSQTKNAKIYNVKLNNVNIAGGALVASLIGQAYETKINNVSASGIVAGKSGAIGGLIGALTAKSTLTNSSTTTNVTLIQPDFGTFSIMGGLVGTMEDSYIDKNYATGSVNGVKYVGGLIGQMSGGGSIVNSYATGTVTSQWSNSTGGLIGWIDAWQNVNIFNCYATGNIVGPTGGIAFGGLIGQVLNASIDPTKTINITISNCYAKSAITTSGGSDMGGFIGMIDQIVSAAPAFINISNSFATGNLSGNENIGGLIGEIGTDLHLSNTYSTGKIIGNGNNLGGLIGLYYATNKNNIISSYWDTQTSGVTSPTCGPNTIPDQCGIAKTTTDMYKQSTYDGWNFVSTWNINEGQSYPWLVKVR